METRSFAGAHSPWARAALLRCGLQVALWVGIASALASCGAQSDSSGAADANADTGVGLGDVGGEAGQDGETGPDTDFGGADTGPADAGEGCGGNEDCARDNPCELGVCGVDGQCVFTALVGKSCDDGDACTADDACSDAGVCVGVTQPPPQSNACESCVCLPDRGVVCSPLAPGAVCDDGDCCTTADRCRVCAPGEPGCSARGLFCAGDPTACDDGEGCTDDACSCTAGVASCTSTAKPDGAACVFNPTLCTLGDQCDSGVCVPGAPAPLSDGNPCTRDLCVKGVVEHIPQNQGQCDDENECTQGDRCFLGACVGGAPVQCEVPECAGSVECVQGQGCVPSWLPAGAVCGGDSACGAGFVCNAQHECVPSAGKTCDDKDLCTVDACDPNTGECVFTPSGGGCGELGPCLQPVCNPATGACDLPAADGTACPGGECVSGQCECVPNCDGKTCGDDGCGGSCGDCPAGETCSDGACLGCDATCPTLCLPDGTCCPTDGFCPTANTTLSGTQAFSVVYIPPGVTVTCEGESPLVLQVQGNVWVEGALRADGEAGTGNPGLDPQGRCGGFAGGDGFRSCVSSATTFCETSAASVAECQSWISPKESFSKPVCEYLASAPGEPGYGPGGGLGGAMAHPIHNGAPGNAAGGGGGSYVTAGQAGAVGIIQTPVCPKSLAGGKPGLLAAVSENAPVGGSGGGAGGLTRAGDCGLVCPLGCTSWGGDGGSGGGVIVLDAQGAIEVSGVVSARGGDGGPAGGATCGGSGGGGAGGVLALSGASVTSPGPQAAHFVVTGGAGGAAKCAGVGSGGAGGAGAVLLDTP